MKGIVMIASKRGFLTGLVGMIAAPAIVRADSLMKLHQIPERWATVWGVGWDLEVVEVPLWEPMSVSQFGGSSHQGGHIEKFREVTDWVYEKPQPPVASVTAHWVERKWPVVPKNTIATYKYGEYVAAQLKGNGPIEKDNGTTRIMGFREMKDWCAQQRPDLGHPSSEKWMDEQIRLERISRI